MKIGTTTFGFRYLLLDPARAPELIEIVERARVLGLDVLQVCENARPMDLADRDWETFVARAAQSTPSLTHGVRLRPRS